MTAVIFKFQQPDGEPVVGAPFTVSLRKSSFDETNEDGILLPGTVEGVTDAQGLCTLELAPGYGLYYLFMLTPGGVEDVDGCMPGMRYKFMVPESDVPVYVEDLIVTVPTFSRPWDEVALSVIIDAKASALASADRAETAAQTVEGDAAAAQQAAASALTSKNAAAVSANAANNSAISASGDAGRAAASATAADTSKVAAALSETNALASKNAAAASATSAATSATTATTQATSATGSATTATTQAAAALASKNAAALSETNAATSAGTALTQANRAKTEADRATAATDGKQPLAANLTAFAGLAGAADRLPYFTGAGALSLATLTAKARLLFARTDNAGMQAELGLVPVTSNIDSTAGRLLTVNSFGVGGLLPRIEAVTVDALRDSGRFYVTVVGGPGSLPGGGNGYLDSLVYANTYAVQEYTQPTTGAQYRRVLSNGVWDAAWSAVPAYDANGALPIAVGGTGAKSALGARFALELVKVESNTDILAGRIVTPGWMGLGTTSAIIVASPNAVRATGFYYASSSSETPDAYGFFRHNAVGAGDGFQEFTSVTTLRSYKRLLASNVWGAWDPIVSNASAVLDPLNGGLMSSSLVGGYLVSKYVNGDINIRGTAPATSTAAANTYTSFAITLPVALVNGAFGFGFAIHINFSPAITNDWYGTLGTTLNTTTVITGVVRNGATAQTFTPNINVWGRWK